jgi:ESF2/ABP1 family protein
MADEAPVADGERAASKPIKKLSAKKIAKFNAENARKGVCYLARIPPYLKPAKLRHLLEGFGTDVLRVYLAPEDKKIRARRLKAGGNKKELFGEGWVEFEDKGVAKRIAASLNNTPIGGAKRSFYASDLWNIKYLSKFKWDNLTEKVAYERKVREQKLRLELAQAKRENAFYVQKVGQAKAFEAMEERKQGRRSPAAAAATGAPPAEQGAPAGRMRRAFTQKPVLKAPNSVGGSAVGLDVLSRVLARDAAEPRAASDATAARALGKRGRHESEGTAVPAVKSKRPRS